MLYVRDRYSPVKSNICSETSVMMMYLHRWQPPSLGEHLCDRHPEILALTAD